EDEVVHAAVGLDEGGGEDGEAAAFLGVARGAEKLLGLDEGLGIDAPGHGAPLVALHVVVAAGEAGNGVEGTDDVPLEFCAAAGGISSMVRTWSTVMNFSRSRGGRMRAVRRLPLRRKCWRSTCPGT